MLSRRRHAVMLPDNSLSTVVIEHKKTGSEGGTTKTGIEGACGGGSVALWIFIRFRGCLSSG